MCEELAMTGTEPARGATGRSGPRLAPVAIGVVVLLVLALAVWVFTAIGGGDDNGTTPGGPTGPNTSPSQQTSPNTDGVTTAGAPQPGNASIQLTPALGADSRRVLVQGSKFGANEEVVLSVDGTEAKRLQTDSSGAFTVSLTVPFSKSSFNVSADGQTSGKSASGTVTF
jgi:hypothetical protein